MKLWINGEPAQRPAAVTLAALVRGQGAKPARVATIVNGTVVPRARRAARRLRAGDRVEIMALAGGG